MKQKAKYALSYSISNNVSVNSPGGTINTDSTLLGSSSSSTRTLTETSYLKCKSGITPDATSGKENLLKNFI